MIKTIYVSCSQVAAAIGRHKYQSQADIARKIIDEQFASPAPLVVDPANAARQAIEQLISSAQQEVIVVELAREKMTSVAAAVEVERKTNQAAEHMQKLIEATVVSNSIATVPNASSVPLPTLAAVIAQERAYEATLVDDPIANQAQAQKISNLEAAAAEIAAIPTRMHQTVSKATGVLAEEAIVDSIERDLFAQQGQQVTDRNTKMKYKSLGVQDGWRVLVGGKPDGLVADQATGKLTVVEAKNRQRRLFRAVPEYERIQCQVYLWLFASEKCVFREHFHGDSWSAELLHDPIELAEIQAGLVSFAQTHIINAAQSTK